MASSRRLTLRRESLTELTSDELAMARGGEAPTLQPGCDTDDVNAYVRQLALKYTIHQHCSWSCI